MLYLALLLASCSWVSSGVLADVVSAKNQMAPYIKQEALGQLLLSLQPRHQVRFVSSAPRALSPDVLESSKQIMPSKELEMDSSYEKFRREGSKAESADFSRAGIVAAVLLSMALVEPAFASDVELVSTAKSVLQPFLAISTIFFLLRIPLSWFPSYDLKKLPWVLIAVPTEPLLKVTRGVFPVISGVDVAPVVWVAITSFLQEILCGPQGVLTIVQNNGGF